MKSRLITLAIVISLGTLLLVGGNKYLATTQSDDTNQVGIENATTTFPTVSMRGYLPNIALRTHENKPVRFYDDLIKDKVVLINFIYTNCGGICVPTTASLVKVQHALGDRLGKDIFFYSITLDPEHDTPERLKSYAEAFSVQPGWLFLTGQYDDIELLRHKLGVYDLDPVIDADKTQHAGLLVYGNETQGTWAAIPALISPQDIMKAILKVM